MDVIDLRIKSSGLYLLIDIAEAIRQRTASYLGKDDLVFSQRSFKHGIPAELSKSGEKVSPTSLSASRWKN